MRWFPYGAAAESLSGGGCALVPPGGCGSPQGEPTETLAWGTVTGRRRASLQEPCAPINQAGSPSVLRKDRRGTNGNASLVHNWGSEEGFTGGTLLWGVS